LSDQLDEAFKRADPETRDRAMQAALAVCSHKPVPTYLRKLAVSLKHNHRVVVEAFDEKSAIAEYKRVQGIIGSEHPFEVSEVTEEGWAVALIDLQNALQLIDTELSVGKLSPNYSIDGKSVSWADYRGMLIKQRQDLKELIILESPYEIRTNALWERW
jgi:hypothetical protein